MKVSLKRKPRHYSQGYRPWTKSLASNDRARVAGYIRRVRNKADFINTRGISGYCSELNISENHLVQLIEQKTTRKSVRILDIGTGKGVFLDELASRFPNKIKLDGISLDGADKKQSQEMFNRRIIPIERFCRPYGYDLIFSVFGNEYSYNPTLALQNTCNSLRVKDRHYYRR
jgi:hypothetical protein